MSTVPTNPVIPHSRPALGEEEVQAVAEVIRSGHIAQGEMVQRFEEAFAEEVGASGAVATSSGTAALHLALIGLGVGPGDEVIIPSFVCSALLNAVRYVGAKPVIADIDPTTGNMDPADAAECLSERTKAVIVPHMFGLPADMDAFLSIGIPVIEDCAQTIGTTYKGRKVGSIGHLAICSFYATKVLTTGEGGMVLSNDWYGMETIRDLNDYDNKDDAKIRYNYKMTDVQAAIGLVQLSRLEGLVSRRREIAEKYRSAFSHFGIRLPKDDPEHIYFRFVMDVGSDLYGWIEGMKKHQISCERPVYQPLHTLLDPKKGYSNTTRAWRSFLSVPIYPFLGEEEIERVIKAFISVSNSSRRG